MINNGGRDLNTHLHGGVTPTAGRRPAARPDPQRRAAHLPLPERPGRGDDVVPRPRARPDRRDGLRRPGRASTSTATRRDAALELPQGDYDVPLMIMDRAFNADGSFRYKLDVDRGYRGDTILVNGQIAPRMKVQRRLYRLRFLNASNARPYALSLGNGRPMMQIASDGGLLPAPVVRTSIPLEPAERVEVLVDFRVGRRRRPAGPEEHDRRGHHPGRHALRRRRRRRQRGGARARRSSSSSPTCRRSTRSARGR